MPIGHASNRATAPSSLLYNINSFLGNKEKSVKFYLMNNFFSQEFNKMFRVGAKIWVGRETGNTGIFFFLA